MLETITVRQEERFSVGRVAEFLSSAGIRQIRPDGLVVEQFTAGHSNLTYLLRDGTWEAVLRRPPAGPVAPRAHDMAREFHILERLHPWFRLAPKPFALCTDVSVIGAPFYVMERRRGLVLDQDLPADWPAEPGLPAAISASLVRVLVDLHAVDWQTAGLGELGRPAGYMQRQVAGWMNRYRRAQTGELPEVEWLANWLPERLPQSQAPTMIHNDYKLNNVLLEPGDPTQVSAVLDWEMATVGDPLSDLGSLLVYWTMPGESDLMGGLRSVTAQPGFATRQELVELYARLSGRDVSGLHYYIAFAYFKVGVILQQIFYRWRQGHTHDDRFENHGAVAANLIRRAAEVAASASS